MTRQSSEKELDLFLVVLVTRPPRQLCSSEPYHFFQSLIFGIHDGDIY